MKTRVGVQCINTQFQLYSVCFDGAVPGDSPRTSKVQALQEARALVKADPAHRELDDMRQ